MRALSKSVKKSDRPYSVRSYIQVLKPQAKQFLEEADIYALKNEIIVIDAQFPWRDPGYVDERVVLMDRTQRPLTTQIRLEIRRNGYLLDRNQLYPYEKYLQKLTYELAKRFPESIVCWEMETVRMSGP